MVEILHSQRKYNAKRREQEADFGEGERKSGGLLHGMAVPSESFSQVITGGLVLMLLKTASVAAAKSLHEGISSEGYKKSETVSRQPLTFIVNLKLILL